MLLKQTAANPTPAQPSVVVSNMSLDSGRKLVSYLINQAVTGLVHVAAVSSALYVFTQLLPEENMVLDNFVYDAQQPLETSEDGTLFKARRWQECKGVYKLTLWVSGCDATRRQEVAILQSAQGVRNVQQYITHEAVEGQPGRFSLIMERLQGGSLLSGLLTSAVVQDFTPAQRFSMVRQTIRGLLTALQGLHARGIAHGAVTADSLYVNASKTEDGERTYTVKLINFTSAVHFAAGERVLDGKLLDLDRDVDTIAPEVLVRSRKGADTGYPVTADAADMWSAGVLLFTVAAKQPPFTSTDSSIRDLSKQHSAWETALQQRRGSHPLLKLLDTAPKAFARLVVRMLQVDPARRISAGEALKHPFFDEHEGGSANGD
jgi:serine/threonine protein kinase